MDCWQIWYLQKEGSISKTTICNLKNMKLHILHAAFKNFGVNP